MGKHKARTAVICICGAAALSLGGMAVYSAFGSAPETAAAQHTVAVERMDIKQYVTVSGTVGSSNVSSVSSNAINTKVREVKVRVGDRVKKGDVIAVLDDKDLQEQLSAAEKQLENTAARNDIDLKAAQRMYDNAVSDKAEKTARSSRLVSEAKDSYSKALAQQQETSDCYNNAVNDRIYKSALTEQAAQQAEEAAAYAAELKAASDAAKSEYAALKADFDRLTADEGASPEETAAAKEACDMASSAADDAADALAEAQAHAKELAAAAQKYSGELSDAIIEEKELKSALSAADRLADEARTAVSSASDAKADTDETISGDIAAKADVLKTTGISAEDMLSEPTRRVAELKRSIGECTVRADCNGIITAVNVKDGELYSGGAIAVVQDDSSFIVSASADQFDIAKLSKDQNTEITVSAVSHDVYSGKLSFVAPTPSQPTLTEPGGNASTTDYALKADFIRQPEGLRIGMTAKLNIITAEKSDVLAVPDNCIITDTDGSSYINISTDGKNSEKVTVETGISNDYYTEISGSGITEDTKVIVPSGDDKSSGSDLFY